MAAEQRFVISARMIGSVHRDTPKLKVFMMSVLWSDEAEVIVYRSFQEFKKFHRQLKKRFPLQNMLQKKDRMIPKFSGEANRSSRQQKESKRSVQRMKFLESYCDKLLKCDAAVTQSSEVRQFFMPKDHDLQPDYTKNSIMILLSDDASGGGGGNVAGSVTHPFVTQTYRCVAAYETKDTKNRPFKTAVDEKLDILIKDPAGWWLVENEDKRLAWFPAPYLELWEGEEDDDDDDAGFQLGGALYCAARSYSAKKDDEVSVPIGSVVEVLRKSDNGWWLIRFNNKGGYIPSMYLQPYNNPRAGLFSLQRKLHSSTLNLATSAELQASRSASTSEENSPRMDPAGPSRGVPGALVLLACVVLLCLVLVAFTIVWEFWGLVVCCALYGYFMGTVGSTHVPMLAEEDVVGIEKMASSVGVYVFIQSFAGLAGPPLAGVLVDVTQNYGAAFYSCAVGMGISAICLALVGPAKSGMCQGPSRNKDKGKGSGNMEENMSQDSDQQDFLEVDLDDSPVRRAVEQENAVNVI